MVICLVVPSKMGGGWEVEPRAGGSVSFTELHTDTGVRFH